MWITSSIEPGETATYTFLFPAPAPGIYYLQFKARINEEDWKKELAKHPGFLADEVSDKRPAFWTGSTYYVVEPTPQ